MQQGVRRYLLLLTLTNGIFHVRMQSDPDTSGISPFQNKLSPGCFFWGHKAHAKGPDCMVSVTHQGTCLSAGVTLVDGVAKLTSDLSKSASNAGQGVVNCITNAFGGGCGR